MNRPGRVAFAAAVALAACGRNAKQAPQVQTVLVERRDIVVEVEATGVVEPINVVEVKSKASGQITRMPVETGDRVKPGDLLVQLDTRDVRNQYNQALADVRAAEARLQVSSAQKRRADELHAQQIITATEHEAATLDYANSQAQLVRARTSLDLAQQRLEDATVRAPVAGTVIEKTVSLGQVIASATGTVGGGTTLLKMADLNQVRVRALVTETDIGGVQPNQQATVMVDAYPGRAFRGLVEKIEPQAVVQQSVTMFPVLVTLDNREGLLKPGMNGEVSVLVERREGVLAVPNDAIRSPREAMSTASLLGLSQESVRAALASQGGGGGGGGGGAGAQLRGGGVGAAGAQQRQIIISPGDVDLSPAGVQGPVTQVQQGRRGAQGAQGPRVEVTAAQCAAVRDALAKKPEAREQLTALMRRAREQEIDRETAQAESRKIYASLGVDPAVARACQMREREARGGADGTTGPVPQGAVTAPEIPSMRGRGGRGGLVFVAENGSYTPRMVMLGTSNYDYTEVLRGLEEGEQVALLSVLALQAQRQEFQDRMRSRTSIPGLQRDGATPAGGRAGGAAPARGARPR